MPSQLNRGGSGRGGATANRTHSSVHNDAIWRQTIRYELNMANNWESRWGFMRDSMKPEAKESFLINQDIPPIQQSKLPALSGQRATSAGKEKPSHIPVECPRSSTQQKHVQIHALPIRPLTNKAMTGLPTKIQPGLRTGTNDEIIGDWLCTYNTPRIIKYRFPSEKYTIPPTTSSDIGWPWERVQQQMGMPFVEQRLPDIYRYTGSFEEMQKAKQMAAMVSRQIPETEEENRQGGSGEGGEISQARTRVPAPYTLERFGKHARGRGDVLKWFGAREALP
ncbi:hypothetical protein BASA50_008200 [Batrachochytrium salamandrivorans]|uniref:Uncharacterized protein n=1 Tax=Batrachochytrium salamandrivorans TaxID=1357716 RepID=A0ABQ8F4V8_9FUNG|nr:hypothetical protein BASA50_008200 [Batrachochytrium salamandrivorans]KAH6598827.1 hypothetical protein BASA61_002763 [Batrachochytrium salamandrivorans]KAJ1332589.1 hypothetical protein BSLG_008218 [Batrachochytrium salamandrivorans]